MSAQWAFVMSVLGFAFAVLFGVVWYFEAEARRTWREREAMRRSAQEASE